jgi:hypothetical protein
MCEVGIRRPSPRKRWWWWETPTRVIVHTAPLTGSKLVGVAKLLLFRKKNKKTKKACGFGRVERRRQRGNVLFSARACSHSLGLKKAWPLTGMNDRLLCNFAPVHGNWERLKKRRKANSIKTMTLLGK